MTSSTKSATEIFLQTKIDEHCALLATLQPLKDHSGRLSAYIQALSTYEDFQHILRAEGLCMPPIKQAADENTAYPIACSRDEYSRLVVMAWASGRPEGDWSLFQSASPSVLRDDDDERVRPARLHELLAGLPGRMHWPVVLGKMTPERQDQVTLLVTNIKDHSKICGLALLMATPQAQLVNSGRQTLERRPHIILARLEAKLRVLTAQTTELLRNPIPEALGRVAQIGFLRRLAENQTAAAWITANRGGLPLDLLQ